MRRPIAYRSEHGDFCVFPREVQFPLAQVEWQWISG